MNTDCDILNLKYLLPVAFLSGSPTSRPIWHQIQDLIERIAKAKPEEILTDLVLQSSLHHPAIVKFPDNFFRVNCFLSWLIDIWKANNWKGQDKLSTLYSISEVESEINYNTYFLGNNINSPMTLLESSEGITRGTTGLSSWGAARVLASWCLNNTRLVTGNVLELGSGIGFTACSLLSSSEALQSIASYTATDYHPHVLSILHHNLSLLRSNQMEDSKESLKIFCKKMCNLLATDELPPGEFREWKQKKSFQVGNTKTRVIQLDWRNPTKLPECDVILAADVVYAVHLFPHLIRVIRLLLTKGNKNFRKVSMITNNKKSEEQRKVFIACTRRNQETLSEFLAEVKKQNLSYEEIYQSTLEREESLFGFDESYMPVKIYKLMIG